MDNKRATVKVRLKEILRNNVDYSKLNGIINDVNKLISLGYLFMRSYILYVIEHNKKSNLTKIEEPVINKNFIRTIFNVIMTKNTYKCTQLSEILNDRIIKKGRPSKSNQKQEILIENLNAYFRLFQSLTDAEAIPIANIYSHHK